MRARLLALALLALTPLALQALQAPQAPNSFDVLIRNGRILDGTGNPWYRADIGITGGGNGTHMVYLSGITDHHVKDADMIDHIVKLVEAKAAEIEASEANETTLDADE